MANKTRHQPTYSVCYCCIAATANGIESVEDGGDGWLPAWRARFRVARNLWEGVPVIVSAGEDCEPFHFSKAPCEYCGDTLAGDRADCVIE